MKKSNLIHIGHCTSPHGIKGEFSFVLYNQEESILKNGIEVVLTPRNENSSLDLNGKIFHINNIKFGNKTIVTLENISNRNEVEAMVPFDIFVDRSLFPDLPTDEYYVNDLLGLEVYEFGSNNKIGIVQDFYENGEQLILKIKTEKEIIEILFLEQFVPVVDIDNNRIEIILPMVIN